MTVRRFATTLGGLDEPSTCIVTGLLVLVGPHLRPLPDESGGQLPRAHSAAAAVVGASANSLACALRAVHTVLRVSSRWPGLVGGTSDNDEAARRRIAKRRRSALVRRNGTLSPPSELTHPSLPGSCRNVRDIRPPTSFSFGISCCLSAISPRSAHTFQYSCVGGRMTSRLPFSSLSSANARVEQLRMRTYLSLILRRPSSSRFSAGERVERIDLGGRRGVKTNVRSAPRDTAAMTRFSAVSLCRPM